MIGCKNSYYIDKIIIFNQMFAKTIIQAADVSASNIDGRVVMEDRQVLSVDVEKAMADVREIAKKIERP